MYIIILETIRIYFQYMQKPPKHFKCYNFCYAIYKYLKKKLVLSKLKI